MSILTIPDLALLRDWLDRSHLAFFECEACDALHLPHLQEIDGVFDAKIDLVDNVLLLSAQAEVRPSIVLPLMTDLSSINASAISLKVFLEIQDDSLPKMVMCQSLNGSVGIAYEQFIAFLQQGEEQIRQVMLESKQNGLLFIDSDDGEAMENVRLAATTLLH